MIDRSSRDKLAEALRQYVSGRITNDVLDDIVIDKRDNGAVAVKSAAWYLYDDLHEHKATDRFYIGKKERKEIARWILFLQSDQEYIWPETSMLDSLLIILTFGLYKRVVLRRWSQVGDASVWPFGSQEELKKSASNPKLLAEKNFNESVK
ncbi:hypothetical protein [Sulfurovum sp.]|uniref:hypothetical protein n=1 Tax=Sulfurovum sp. TaxID=1969726 RepID=UPI0035641264